MCTYRIEIEKCLHKAYQNHIKIILNINLSDEIFKYDKNMIVSPPVI